MRFLIDRMEETSMNEPRVGRVFSIILSMISMSVLATCLTRRIQNVQDWSRYPLVCWLVILIYLDSLVFVLGTAIVSAGYGVNHSKHMCSNAILLCISCYMTTKVLIYYFLVERVQIIRVSSKPRIKDPLYLFNSFGMLIPYCAVIALNFIFRFSDYKNGECRIGMKQIAMIPLIGFDIFVNVYLTLLFLVPLQGLYSYQNDPNSQTRAVAQRTFVGSCCTLTSSVINLTLLLVLKGEPGWICLMCCNVDILFSVLVLHWITTKDNASTFLPRRPRPHSHDQSQTPCDPNHSTFLPHRSHMHPYDRSHRYSYPATSTNIPHGISPHARIPLNEGCRENIVFTNPCSNSGFHANRNGTKIDDGGYRRDNLNIDSPAKTGTVTTTVTAGVGEKLDAEREMEDIARPKMAITVERGHVREVMETRIRIVEKGSDETERLRMTLPRTSSWKNEKGDGHDTDTSV